jgi:putative transposase
LESAFRFKGGKLTIAKSKQPLNVKWSRELSNEPSSVTISKDIAGRYFVSMLCEFESIKLRVSSKMVGVDPGLNHLFISSDGFKQKKPKFIKYQAKLATFQQRMSKQQQNSSNRNKARQKVARLPAKIAGSKLDALHKASRKLINENQVVCVENLR